MPSEWNGCVRAPGMARSLRKRPGPPTPGHFTRVRSGFVVVAARSPTAVVSVVAQAEQFASRIDDRAVTAMEGSR